jgi:hypothetical protein
MKKAWTVKPVNTRQIHSKRFELCDPDDERVAVITVEANYAIHNNIVAALNLTTQVQRTDWLDEERHGRAHPEPAR